MEKRDVVLYLKPFQGATDEFSAALVESHSIWGRRKSLMTNVRWEGCLKGISSTSALMFPSRREKCQKVEHAFVCVCVCVRTHPQADMVVIRITLGSVAKRSLQHHENPPGKPDWREARRAKRSSSIQKTGCSSWLICIPAVSQLFFPLKYRKRLHESPIKNDERSQQIGSHVLSIQQNAGENMERHRKFPQP